MLVYGRYMLLAMLVALAPCLPAPAGENWPDFRGPTLDGHSNADELPLQWSETQNIRWKTPIAGRGWSTPVIWGEQVWLTTGTSDRKQLLALCIDREKGEVLHRVKLFDVEKPEPVNAMNSYASPSPVIEAGRVYVHFGTYGTAAIDTASAKVLWRRSDLKLDHREGPGSSPVLIGDRLVVTCDGADVQYIAGLDKNTGETRWKTNRTVKFGLYPGDLRKAFSTPLVAEVRGKPQLITTAAHSAYGYEPESGKELWRIAYSGFSNVCRPVVGNDLMYLNTGYMKPQMIAVKLGGSGLVPESQVVWKQAAAVPNKPSVLLDGDLLYMVNDGGVASCLDAKTGEAVWTNRLGGSFSASIVLGAGRLYLCDQDGKTHVLRPGREFKELAVNQLDDGLMASPAVSGKSLFLRTKTCLYRVETSP